MICKRPNDGGHGEADEESMALGMARQELTGRGRALREVLARLRAAGYDNKNLLTAVVPDWWTKETEEESDAAVQLKIILARRLGLDVQAMIEQDVIRAKTPSGMRFKRSANLEHKTPSAETLAFCATLAQTAAATIDPSMPIPSDPDTLRQNILANGESFVSLGALLKYCWMKNIAVMHVTEVPGLRKGMDALVYRANQRDIIIVTKAAKKYPSAWLSFLIAHELGHIALGHVEENELYADECEPGETGLTDEDAANAFAGRALAGNYVDQQAEFMYPEQLIAWAYNEGRKKGIDPGHLILRYAHHHEKCFAFALKAWNRRPAPTSYENVVNEIALSRINTDALSDSMGELVENVLHLT
jgi:hypothetical protein